MKDTLGPANGEREVVHSSEVENVRISTIGVYFGALQSVLCREVIHMLSFIQSVL